MYKSLFRIFILAFFLSQASTYLQDHLDLKPTPKELRKRTSYSGVLDPTIDDQQILNLDTRAFFQLVDRYMQTIVLFNDGKEEHENEVYEGLLESLLPWKLKNSACAITRVVVRDLKELPTKLRPEKTPSLVFFVEKKKLIYQGELSPAKLLAWVQQIAEKEVQIIHDQEDFNEFTSQDNSPKLIGFYDSTMTEEVKILRSLVETGVLLELGIYKVGVCFENCTISYKEKTFERPALVLFRSLYDVNEMAKLNRGLKSDNEILQFCNKESISTLTVLNDDTARVLFLGFAPFHLILVLNPKDNNEKILEDFNKSAGFNRKEESYRARIVHSIYYVDEELSGFNEIFGVKKDGTLPELIMVNVSDSGMTKYVYNNTEINYSNIREFIKDFQQKSLLKFLLSEPIPHEAGNPALEKLVGLNLRSKVIDSPENYAVLFCENMEWQECGYSFKIFQYIAEKAKAKAKVHLDDEEQTQLKFGYVNTEKNEFEFSFKSKFPVIVLFPAENKNKPYEFGALHTIENVVDWLSEILVDFQLVIGKKEIQRFENEILSSKEREIYDRAKQMDKEEKILKVEEQKLKQPGRVYNFDL